MTIDSMHERVAGTGQRRAIGALLGSALALCFTGCALSPADAGDSEASDEPGAEENVGTAAAALTVSGVAHYCSMTWNDAGWAFTWNAGDPCADLAAFGGPGGKIKRAGVYSLADVNNVVVQCNGSTGIWVGVGEDPMHDAYDNVGSNASDCVFTVAPKSMPIFDSPFPAGTSIASGTGFDFAKAPYNHLNVHDFGQSGSTSATVVDWKGRDRGGQGFEDNHDAHDWGVAEGTAVVAVAAGTVRKRRMFNTGCSGSNSPIQGEVYLDHTVVRSPSTYNEKFTSGYFHMIDFKKHDGTTLQDGETVTRGEQIGHVGWVGCATGPHLHYAVIRMSNTATERFPVLTIDASGNDGWREVIEPNGFDPPQGFDPWGWMGYSSGVGALSIRLWNSGQAPPSW